MSGKGNDKRFTIGYLTQFSSSPGGFQDIVWQCMVDASRRRDVNMVIFPGGSVDTAPYNPHERALNSVYELISKEKIDGLIINFVIGAFISRKRFGDFCRSFSLPVVLTYGSLKGFPDVHAVNEDGMRGIIRHLITVHRARRIAFITGARGYPDAEERFAAYRDTLRECGIRYDASLTFKGKFDVPSGMQAVNHWLKDGNREIDAIVASNDAMAFGAIHALRLLGRDVPDDIAVTGFDDTAEAQFHTPPLTTVRQPFTRINLQAIDLLCDLLEGKAAPHSIAVPAELVLRQSCGCLSETVNRAEPVTGRFGAAPAHVKSRLPSSPSEELIREFGENNPARENELIAQVVSGFIEDVNSLKSEKFIRQLRGILQQTIASGGEVFVWQRRLFTLREWVTSLRVDDSSMMHALNLILHASVLIGESAIQSANFHTITNYRRSRELLEAGRELITTFNFKELKGAIKGELKRLHIPSYFIAFFHGGGTAADGMITFVSTSDVNEDERGEGAATGTARSLPGGTFFPSDRKYVYAVHPLTFRDQRLGYALFEMGPTDGAVYSTLEVLISSSLMGSELIRQKEQTEEAQRRMIEKQRQDAEELAAANRDLEAANRDLEASNRELESFSYSVSHDLRAPLRAMNGFASILVEEYGKHLPEAALRHVSTIVKSARMMGRLIDGLLEFSRLSRQPLEQWEVSHKELVRETLEDLRREYGERNVSVEVGELPDARGDPTLIRQVWVNLLGNAFKFSRYTENARITVGSSRQNGKTAYFVKDNGVGFDMRYAAKLFRVFQRLHSPEEYEGTGVGLAMVQRIVTRHGGRIWAEAKPGEGATFYFTLE